MDYAKIWLKATNAKNRLLDAQRDLDEAMAKLNNAVRPCCEKAIDEFNKLGGVRITLEKDGITYS